MPRSVMEGSSGSVGGPPNQTKYPATRTRKARMPMRVIFIGEDEGSRLAGKTTAACAASRTCPSFTPTDGACRVRNPRDVSDRALEIVDTLQVPRILTNKWPTIFRICERAAGSECAGSSWDNRQGRTCGQGDAEEHLKRRKGMGNSGTFRAKVQVSTRCDAS